VHERCNRDGVPAPPLGVGAKKRVMSITYRRLAPIVTVILFSCLVFAQQREDPARGDGAEEAVDLLWGVKIPLRDGVKLNASVYRPKQIDQPLPVIFTLTPYTADTYYLRALYFARNGYVFVLVDVRGRGNSEGVFEPMRNEAHDGYDVVEWLARQSWSNGNVAMWGGSYAGFDQWATLKELPPHLKTIVPAAAAYPSVEFPFFNNVFPPSDMQWLTLTSGVTANWSTFYEQSFWIEKFRELYLTHAPFSDLGKLVGNLSTHFNHWLEHPTPDAYWQLMSPTASDYRRMDLPILSITGDYDEDQRGALHYYRMHMQYGSAEARGRHYLMIGPWDHAGTRTPTREVGGLKFGDAAMLDLNELHKEWYGWTLKNGDRPKFLKNHVAYYLLGADEWKYSESLDAISNEKRILFLNSDGHANDVFRSGTLDENPGGAPPDTYVYDPLDVRPAQLEQGEIKAYVTDQRYALNLFGNGLVYHSEPFVEDTEITGNIRFVVWISMDVPDTDFEVDVYEIMPDGTSINLTSDMMRARYRESPTVGKLVSPGEINRYDFNTFQFFSRRIAKGSRLRLILKCPNSIYWEKNYNSSGVVAEESGKDARTAHIKVYHDSEHASFLELPLVK
jgi:uncharacterized protein